MSKRASGEAPDARLHCASRGSAARRAISGDALLVQERPVFLVDIGNVVGQPADDEASRIAGYLRLAGMEFLLKIEAGGDELVVLRLMSLIGGIAIFDEIGFLGGEVLRDIGDQRVELLTDGVAVAGADGVAELLTSLNISWCSASCAPTFVANCSLVQVISDICFTPSNFFWASGRGRGANISCDCPRRRALHEYAGKRRV